MIYECPKGHISFTRDSLEYCGMKGCGKAIIIISPLDIDWFYKINPHGLCIERKELHKIAEDPNIPKDAKNKVKEVFSEFSC